jgi:hypothetical protein
LSIVEDVEERTEAVRFDVRRTPPGKGKIKTVLPNHGANAWRDDVKFVEAMV